MLAALLLAMLVAGLNYSSNLALIFAFLMSSVGIVAMHQCHRNLQALTVGAVSACDAFAGGHAAVRITARNPSCVTRYDLEFCAGGGRVFATLAPAAQTSLEIAVATPRREVIAMDAWQVRTRYPFGWFRAWTYVHTQIVIYVAPQPAGGLALPSHLRDTDSFARESALAGDEEFAGLRAYRPGDARKQMAWKSMARGGEPAVRHYVALAGAPEWLDWSALPHLSDEAKLAQLCAWVLQADARGIAYGLRLPRRELPPEIGNVQRILCLRALAEFSP